jgi:hypothetical protein
MDNHHQELVLPDERDRPPCGHSCANMAEAEAVRDVRAERRDNTGAEQPPS